MAPRIKNWITAGLAALFCAGGLLGLVLGGGRLYSESERRLLAERPELTLQSLQSGDFMEQAEDWAKDQFPLRESFRRIKALAARYLLGQRVVNGLYRSQGHLCAVEKELNGAMLDHAAERFGVIYESYLEPAGSQVWLSIVPDKHYYLAAEGLCLRMDYEALVQTMREEMPYAEYVDLFSLLSIDDYYRTDSHWRQERLGPAAQALAQAMGAELSADYETVTLSTPFYGVYAGQSALPTEPDGLSYCTNDVLEGCTVTSWDKGYPEPAQMYDLTAAEGRDPYEMFLCGADALVTVENPAAPAEKELIVFRDSFASSLVPLLAEAYGKITLVDIRYVQSDYLENFVDFHGQDVLFLYSTSLLNNSLALR